LQEGLGCPLPPQGRVRECDSTIKMGASELLTHIRNHCQATDG
jgi:hypothetical protein